jgi:hypothetical protein
MLYIWFFSNKFDLILAASVFSYFNILKHLSLEKHASNKHTSLLGQLVSYKKMNCCEYRHWAPIHKTSFSSELMNWPNKLECYLKNGWTGFPVSNTLAFQVHS